MRYLVVGGNGMLGHVLCRYLNERTEHHVLCTARAPIDDPRMGGLRTVVLDVRDGEGVRDAVSAVRPDVVVNCAGVLNAAAEADPRSAIQVNSVLPRVLADAASRCGAVLVHVSTDCVFSGMRGSYTEKDEPDGTSMYARTKALGEVGEPHLTIRTSIIGPEIRLDGIGLLRWFLSRTGVVPGYSGVPWNGVTTLELSSAIVRLVDLGIRGLAHYVSPVPIMKADLLEVIRREYECVNVLIQPDDHVRIDRTLLNTRTDVPHAPASYPDMVRDMRRFG